MRRLFFASPAITGYDDSAYTGVVATPTGGNGQGYYGLLTRAETNPTGMWYGLTTGSRPPGTTGGGMINSNPSDGSGQNAASFEIHFQGTGFRLWGLRNNQYGEAMVLLDGQPAANCSYRDGSGVGIVYEVTPLPAGRHVIRFTCLLNNGDPNYNCVPQYYQILA